MVAWERAKYNLNQIFAIAEKNLRVYKLRYKTQLVMEYINPFISILLPFIIMNQLFNYNESFGPWNRENYLIYILIGYNIILLQKIISDIPSQFITEKYWMTLQALMIAPFNRFNLLFGIILSHFIVISVPFFVFFIICFILFPISIITLLSVILIIFLILLIFSGIGLIIGIFSISNESIRMILGLAITLIFYFSCISYPYQVFPDFIQFFVNLNPVYYIIDILRLMWIENDILYTINNHPFHFIILMTLAGILPVTGIVMFNYIFKKYGIVGY